MISEYKNFIAKVIVNGEFQEIKIFGKNQEDVLDDMVDTKNIDQVLEITEECSGKRWIGGGSLKPLRDIKKRILEVSEASNDLS